MVGETNDILSAVHQRAPSVLFDAVVPALSADGAAALAGHAAALGFERDAHAHLKVVGYAETATALLDAAGIAEEMRDEGYVPLGDARGTGAFVKRAKQHRIGAREPKVNPVP